MYIINWCRHNDKNCLNVGGYVLLWVIGSTLCLLVVHWWANGQLTARPTETIVIHFGYGQKCS